MKVVRYRDGQSIKWGVAKDDSILEMRGNPFGRVHLTSKRKKLNKVKLLAPCLPSKIIALGLNYRDHAKEFNTALPSVPILFMKPPSALIGPDEGIAYPKMSRQVDFEGELAVVIGKTAKNVPEEKAADYILGYTCLNDVTARDLQPKDGQWTTSKSFDTFAPMGPWIVTDIDPAHLEISSFLNGKRRQHSNTRYLIFGVNTLVSFISRIMTLLPGDVISTGTPSGVGPMAVGDRIDVAIEGVGTLSNHVVAEG